MLLDATEKTFYFLQGGEELGQLIREYEWEKTSLGSPDQWPYSLRTMVSTVITSKFPMLLWWGDDLLQFYNDAFKPSFGNEGKHPTALGQRAEDCWVESWDFAFPLIEKVRTTGESVWAEDQLVRNYRNGILDDVYWTFSYSPVYGDTGTIEGVLVVCTETTEKILSIRRLEASNQRFRDLVRHAPVAIAVFRGPDLVAEVANDAYLPLVGRTREQFVGKPLFEALPEVKEELNPITENLLKTGEPFYAME